MSWYQTFALSFLNIALTALTLAIKNPESRIKYRTYCLTVWLAARQIKEQFPNDPDFI